MTGNSIATAMRSTMTTGVLQCFLLHHGASRYAARQARRARPRGAGGRVRHPGRSAGAVHALAVWAAQPSTGGRERTSALSFTTLLCPLAGA